MAVLYGIRCMAYTHGYSVYAQFWYLIKENCQHTNTHPYMDSRGVMNGTSISAIDWGYMIHKIHRYMQFKNVENLIYGYDNRWLCDLSFILEFWLKRQVGLVAKSTSRTARAGKIIHLLFLNLSRFSMLAFPELTARDTKCPREMRITKVPYFTLLYLSWY